MGTTSLCHVVTDLTEPGVADTLRALCDHLPADRFPWHIITGPMQYQDTQTRNFLQAHPGRFTILPSIAKAGSALARGKYSLVHTHTAKAGFWGRLGAGNASVVHTPYGQSLKSSFPGWCAGLAPAMEQYAAKPTRKFISLTELEKKQLVASNGVPEKKIAVIPLGLDWDTSPLGQEQARLAKTELGILPEETVVAMIGRIEPSRGPRPFLEAATTVAAAEPNVKFLIVGEGSLREEMEGFVRRQGIEQRVVFTGWREDMTSLIGILDILASPGEEEETGTFILKAQAKGKAVIATDAGCAPEIISTGRTGMLIQPRNASVLAQAILELVRNRGKCEFLGRQAQQMGSGKFDPARTARLTGEVYHSLSLAP